MHYIIGALGLYVIVMFTFGCILGLPDNNRSISNSMAMGTIMVFYPVIILLQKTKSKRK